MLIKTVCIDPGHGGTDRANRGPTGYIEADGVLDIALKLRDILTKKGIKVIMTREKDTTISLYDRARVATTNKVDLMVSIHTNAGVATAHGIETFHTLNNEWGNTKHRDDARRVAQEVQKRLVQGTGLRDRGIKTRLVETVGSPIRGLDFYGVIRMSNCPTILPEVGFHSNPNEEKLLKDPAFRSKCAQLIADGILVFAPQVDDSLEKAVASLHARGLMNSPDYWLRVGKGEIVPKPEFVAQLLKNFANIG